MISAKGRSPTTNRVHLPELGRRGEGWVVLLIFLFVVVIGSGFLGPLWGGPARTVGAIVGGGLLAFGIGLIAAGILALRRQLTAYPMPVPGGRLIEAAAFGLVRHPIYGGAVIAALGWGLALAAPGALAGVVVLAIFFDVKSRREEAWLNERFVEYAAYQRRTHRLIPWLY